MHSSRAFIWPGDYVISRMWLQKACYQQVWSVGVTPYCGALLSEVVSICIMQYMLLLVAYTYYSRTVLLTNLFISAVVGLKILFLHRPSWVSKRHCLCHQETAHMSSEIYNPKNARSFLWLCCAVLLAKLPGTSQTPSPTTLAPKLWHCISHCMRNIWCKNPVA